MTRTYSSDRRGKNRRAPLNLGRLRAVSPSMRLLRGLGGRVLPCGCLVGVYETYGGDVVATIDSRGLTCSEPAHHLHTIVPPDALNPAHPQPAGATVPAVRA